MVALLTLAACPPAPRPAPLASAAQTSGAEPGVGVGPLTSAMTIEVRDTWVGLGCTHDFEVSLVADADGWRGEATMKVGWGQDPEKPRAVRLSRAAVAALEEAAVAARQALADERAPTEARSKGWTDDYPSGSMTFTTPSGTRTIGFTDQWRVLQWDEGGAVAMLDRPHDLFGGDSDEPAPVWQAYGAILAALDLRLWIDEACGRQR